VSGDERLRLFLALRLPDDVLDEIERWQRAQLRASRRPREHLHVTLAFLGHGRRRARAIVGVLRDAAAERGRSAHAGALPRDAERRHARPRGRRRAARLLAADVQERLERLGVYRREGRPWLPHLTVARWRERPRLRLEPPPVGTFVPSDAAAYLSRLHPDGARYEVLESVALGG
jgi:2'-5' RNA ligase